MSDELLKKLIKEQVQEEIKIKPAIETILLDDISRGVRAVKERLEAQVPEGFKEEVEFTVEGTTAVPLQPKLRKPPFHRATLFNDGPDAVYVFLNEVKAEAYRKAPLNSGDKLDIDTTEAKIEALFVACTTATGRASGRCHLLK